MKSKIKKTKKGISPLIATVLLVGFVIAIAALLWMWWGNIVKEQAEKTAAQSQGKMVCSSEVGFSVTDASCYNSTHILLYLENKGITKIDDFRIQISGANQQGTVTLSDSLEKTESKQTSVPANQSSFGAITKVTVMPIVIRQSSPITCKDQAIEIIPAPC